LEEPEDRKGIGTDLPVRVFYDLATPYYDDVIMGRLLSRPGIQPGIKETHPARQKTLTHKGPLRTD
jgi:hypothetical protein